MVTETDVTIVGAGPVGLFAIFACGQLGMRCAVVDSLPKPGGQLTALYPEKPIYDIPSQPEIRADDLVAMLVEQAKPYKPEYILGQSTIDGFEKENDLFTLKTSNGEVVQSRVVIIAAGAGIFGPKRPPLRNIESFEDVSVFYHVFNREKYSNKTVMIAGGGDSAVDWAISLSKVARQIYVVHRRESFRAAPATVDELREIKNITLMIPYQLHSLNGEDGILDSVSIQSIENDSIENISTDYLIPLFGLANDITSFNSWLLTMRDKTIVVNKENCQTSCSGIYAIGDIADYPGKLRLILTGFAEASQAAHHAYQYAYPDKKLHFEYSTTRGIPRDEANNDFENIKEN